MNESSLNEYTDQTKLHILSQKVMDKFENLLDLLDINLKYSRKMYYGCCPVHGGDKYNALNIFHTGNTYRGNWKCHTLQCEKYFKPTVLGFIRGILSHQKYNWKGPSDKSISFNETIKFVLNFLDEDYSAIQINQKEIERNKFVKTTDILNVKNKQGHITRKQIRNALSIPASYYLNRGYSKQILDEYDVGLCNNPKKQMFNRVVVPIYDDNYKYMIGCTGRSVFEKCPQCHSWHNPTLECNKVSKWKHSDGFEGTNYLYNYWKAKKHIANNRIAIVVESPGNVWRLEESGINNSVGLFGTALSVGQKVLLDSSGALSLILLMDNDDAGQRAIQAIKEQCNNTYYIHTLNFQCNDVGEMSIEQINNELRPQIDKIKEI